MLAKSTFSNSATNVFACFCEVFELSKCCRSSAALKTRETRWATTTNSQRSSSNFPQNKSLIVWLHGYTYTLQAYFHCLEYFHQTGLSSTAAAVYAAVRLGQSLVQRHFHCDSGSTMLCLDATIMTNLGRTILQDAIATPTGYQRMPKSLEMEIKCSSSHQINSRVSEKNALIIYIYYIIYIIYYIIYIYHIQAT